MRTPIIALSALAATTAVPGTAQTTTFDTDQMGKGEFHAGRLTLVHESGGVGLHQGWGSDLKIANDVVTEGFFPLTVFHADHRWAPRFGHRLIQGNKVLLKTDAIAAIKWNAAISRMELDRAGPVKTLILVGQAEDPAVDATSLIAALGGTKSFTFQSQEAVPALQRFVCDCPQGDFGSLVITEIRVNNDPVFIGETTPAELFAYDSDQSPWFNIVGWNNRSKVTITVKNNHALDAARFVGCFVAAPEV